MPKIRYLRARGIVLTIGASLFVALAFNNCAPQSSSPLTSSALTIQDKESILYKNEPFAFDAVVDTISYNSCFNDGLRSSSVFGFKVSASEIPIPGDGARSGVRISKDFLDFVGKQIKPQYPSDVITSTQLKQFIQNSPLSGKALPLIGIRNTNNLSIRPETQNVSGAAYVSGVDFFQALNILTDKNYLPDLADGVSFTNLNKVLTYGPRVADFDTADDVSRGINVEMGYNLKSTYYELYPNAIRDELNKRNTALTLTFHNGTSADGPLNPLSPDPNDLKKAFGRIFYLNFGAVTGAAHNSVPANLLRTVEERDLAKATIVSNASWTCSNFMIVRSEDQQDFCRPLDYSSLAAGNSFYRDAVGAPRTNFELLKDIRRHYPASNWDVGIFANYAVDTVANGTSRPFVSHPAIPGLDADADTNLGTGDQVASYLCVVPRTTSCYMSNLVNNVDQGVDYFPTSNPNGCLQISYQNQGIQYGGGVPTKICAQWASTCIRTSYGY